MFRNTFETEGSQTSNIDKSPLIGGKTKYLLFCIPEEWVLLPEDGHVVKVANSNLSTTFLLVNAMIGAGILVQGYVFNRAGIVSCIFEYIIIGIMVYLGVEMLALCGENRKIFDYSSLAKNMLGEYGKTTVDISVVVNNTGALLSYMLIIGSLFKNILDEFSSCNAGYCNIAFLTAIPVALFTIPLCLIRQFGHLALISYLSIIVISGVLFLVLIGGPIHAANQHYAPNTVKSGSFVGTVATVGDIVFALGYTTFTFHAYNAMENKNLQNFQEVSKVSTLIGVLMCFFTGLFGYLSFRSDTQPNILINFTGPVSAVFKVGLIIHLVLYIPGDFVVLRASLWRLFSVDVNSQSNFLFVTTTLSSILLITMVAVLLQVYVGDGDSLNTVVNLTGGMGGSVVYFIVPGMMGWKLYKEELQLHATAQNQSVDESNNNSDILFSDINQAVKDTSKTSTGSSMNRLKWKSISLFSFGILIVTIVFISNL